MLAPHAPDRPLEAGVEMNPCEPLRRQGHAFRRKGHAYLLKGHKRTEMPGIIQIGIRDVVGEAFSDFPLKVVLVMEKMPSGGFGKPSIFPKDRLLLHF